MGSKTKILMYGKHFAYIDKKIMNAFDINCRVVNFAAWIREKAFEDFNLLITNSLDIEELDDIVVENYYSDKTEWLREKLRNQIRLNKPSNEFNEDE